MLKRRTFLQSFVAASACATQAGLSADTTNRENDIKYPSGSIVLPDWANEQIDKAVQRFKDWKGTDETVAFTFVTDVHSFTTTYSPKPNFADSRYHVIFAQAAADRAGCDFLVDGGDHDYDNLRPTPEMALKRMAVTQQVYEPYCAKPVLFCLGNHDHGSYPKDGKGERPISSSLFGDTFNGLAEKHGFAITFGKNRSWGYYDVPKKNFRAIFCNTSDEGYYGLSMDQIGFIESALKTMPPKWSAALFGHFCVFDEIGHWKQYQTGDKSVHKREFMAMLQNFVKTRPNDLVGYFCGDSHFDNQLEYRGVNWTISQGYGGIGRADRIWGARTTPFNRSKSMLFELIAVKPRVGEFKVFRVGAGDSGCDRTCVYFNKF